MQDYEKSDKFLLDNIIIEILRCPSCHTDNSINSSLICGKCGKKYSHYKGVPILINKSYEEYDLDESEENYGNARIYQPIGLKSEKFYKYIIFKPSAQTEFELLRLKYEYPIKLCNYTLDYFSKYITNDNYKILDIGSGTGTYDHLIVENHPSCYIFGIEIIKNAAAISQELLGGAHLEYICADATNLPIISNHFDIVYTKNSVEHAGISMMEEIYRVLKPGGKALIIGPGYIQAFTCKPLRLIHLLISKLKRKKYEVHGFKVSVYKKTFRSLGFHLIKHDAFCFNTKQRSYSKKVEGNITILKIMLFFNNIIEKILRRLKLFSFLWIQVFELMKPRNKLLINK
ncbi:hypothetical protein LCGC14_1116510 [marine sediment metagenome]|uniref:Methyltransferase type 11 domain-containing protein n=1 Tax=marine sediment metagenome TaxID=412755 RepID=A0A0F9PN98_9ZZZZ